MPRRPAEPRPYDPVTEHPEPGLYKRRVAGVWYPAKIAIEHSTDDEGRVADRPRLVLWFRGERYERGAIRRFWPMHKVNRREYDLLMQATSDHDGTPLAERRSLF